MLKNVEGYICKFVKSNLSFEMQIILLSSDSQMNVSITWFNQRDVKINTYVWMGIYTQQYCDQHPELEGNKWLRCINFNPDIPSWHILKKRFMWPAGPKLSLEYRVHKNSGTTLNTI
mgnify:CR=1 FL=1